MVISPSLRRGFTLIELMVVIAIAAIVAVIALPSYSAYVERGKRASARSALLDVAGFLDRSFATNGCYNRTTVADCQTQTGATLALPAALAFAPSDGRPSHALTVSFAASATGQAYTLTATPCATAGTCPAGSDPFVDAKCGSLTLTHAGVRGVTGSGSVAECWQR